MNRNFSATFITAAAFFLFVLFSCAAGPGADKQQPIRESMKTLIKELDLSPEQAEKLRIVLDEYKQKRIQLEKNSESATQEEKSAELQNLQRWFYEELSTFLTPEQIEKYRKMVEVKKNSREKEQETAPSPAALKNLEAQMNKIPFLRNLRKALSMIELSGLQKDALNQFFSGVVAQLLNLDRLNVKYDLMSDDNFQIELEKQLTWILTPTQYQELFTIMETMPEVPSGSKSPKP